MSGFFGDFLWYLLLRPITWAISGFASFVSDDLWIGGFFTALTFGALAFGTSWLLRADLWPRKPDEEEVAWAARQRRAALRPALGTAALVVVVRAFDALAGR